MAQDFLIKKGLSTSLFDTEGNCILPAHLFIENCWYLTTDTAEVYVALRQFDDSLKLHKINSNEFSAIQNELNTILQRVAFLETKTDTETFAHKEDFPLVGEVNKLYVAVEEKSTYVWYDDSYVCVDEDEEPTVICGGSAD